jgi:hypothetical protein
MNMYGMVSPVSGGAATGNLRTQIPLIAREFPEFAAAGRTKKINFIFDDELL